MAWPHNACGATRAASAAQDQAYGVLAVREVHGAANYTVKYTSVDGAFSADDFLLDGEVQHGAPASKTSQRN